MNIDQTNIRIRDFYKKNPHIDFETINLLIIDLFERVLDNPQNKGELPHLKILNDLEGMFQKYNSTNTKSTTQSSVEKLNTGPIVNNEFKTINLYYNELL